MCVAVDPALADRLVAGDPRWLIEPEPKPVLEILQANVGLEWPDPGLRGR
jgi:hypothetical protein